jgi:O-antigen/teichoic acid export membrane protein
VGALSSVHTILSEVLGATGALVFLSRGIIFIAVTQIPLYCSHMSPQLRKLSRETALLTAGNIVSLSLGLIGGIIIARVLGDEARGVYAWVFTLQGFACQLAALATYHAARQLASQTPKKEWPRLIGALATFAALGSVLGLSVLIYGLFHPLAPDYTTLLLLAFLGVPVMGLAMPLAALVHVQGHAIRTFMSMVSLRLLLLIATVTLWVGGGLNLTTLTLANIMAALLTLVFLLVSLRLNYRNFATFLPQKQFMQTLSKAVGPAWVAGLGLYALPKIAILVLATGGDLAAAGHLAVALTLFEAAISIPGLAAGVLVSHLALNETDLKARRKITLAMLGISGLMAIGGLLIGPWLIPVLFGSAFTGSVLPFQILMACLVLGAVHQAWFSRLIHAKQASMLMIPPLLGCLTVVLFGAFWVSPFGAFEAAMATLMGYGVLVLSTYALKGTH